MADPCKQEAPQGRGVDNHETRIKVLENNQENIDSNLVDLKDLVKENRDDIREIKNNLRELSNGGMARKIQEQNELLIEKYVELGNKEREARDAKDKRQDHKELQESKWEYKLKSKELWVGLITGTVGMKILQWAFTALESYLKQGGF